MATNTINVASSHAKSRTNNTAESRKYSVSSSADLSARTEPFDSFWEGPEDVEKGYRTFGHFYRHNYLSYMPINRQASILVVSCGPGYFVDLLAKEGYTNVLGIDSFSEKVRHAQKRNLNCRVERAFEFLDNVTEPYDVIFCEQELNHLTKDEIVVFLNLCWSKLKPEGTLIVHGLNGANPITGADALAQNFDHFNTFTEYSLRQVLDYCGFYQIKVIPLNLYVFYTNPFNYVAMFIAGLLTLFFQFTFKLYGKFNRLFTKKIAAICKKHS
jgi:SAM-dependent methyltransferase